MLRHVTSASILNIFVFYQQDVGDMSAMSTVFIYRMLCCRDQTCTFTQLYLHKSTVHCCQQLIRFADQATHPTQ